MSERAERLCDEGQQLRGEMSAMHAVWQDCADHALPLRRLGFQSSGSTFSAGTKLQSDTAVDALNTLASGMVSWVTPSQRHWFEWEPADGLESEDVAAWLSDCTRRAHLALANSNFYHAVHLGYLDLGAFGTVGLHVERGRSAPLNFKALQTGSFACAENAEGTVDRVFRYFSLTAVQAVERFGDGAPDECRADIAANRKHSRYEFVHAVFPRSREEMNPAGGPLGMPFASVYLYPARKQIVFEDGFESHPVMVSRWLKFAEDCPYGASPAMLSIADIRGNNYLESLLAAMANLKVNPRIITQTGAASVVDLGPGGITQVKSMNEAPQVWADPSEYRIGLDLLDRVENRIRRAFHVPLFEQFAALERQITAAEVYARQAEQLARVSPAFTLLTTDLINPLLERVFLLLFQGGHFAQPPQEAFTQDAAGQWRLLYPKTVQISRMAKAIQEQEQQAFGATIEQFLPLIQGDMSLLDNFDLDIAIRDTARGKGVPASYYRTADEIAQLRQARAQQQMQAQLAELAAKNPDAAAAVAGDAAA